MTNTTATRSLQLLLRLDCHPVPVGPVAINRDEQCSQKTPAVFEVEGENLPQGNLCLNRTPIKLERAHPGADMTRILCLGTHWECWFRNQNFSSNVYQQ